MSIKDLLTLSKATKRTEGTGVVEVVGAVVGAGVGAVVGVVVGTVLGVVVTVVVGVVVGATSSEVLDPIAGRIPREATRAMIAKT
ncbi:hypothetical protein GCM10027580_12050 [Corynebacterium faecale]